jgi:hypothetical protein
MTGAARGATNSGSVLFGDQTIEANQDQNSAGWAEAFPFASANSGTATSVSVYVDGSSSARTLIAGIYSDKSGHPGSLLGSGSLASPKRSAWNVVTVQGAAVSAGSTYWIAVLGTGGRLYFRDRASGPCLSENSAQSSLTALPSTWTSGPEYNTCPISAYAQAAAGSSPQSAPSNTSAPVVSGSAVQGQTLSVSNGSWSTSPTSYAYRWQDCDSAGANCTAISGATYSSYTLQASDVGHTMRAVVTASNSAGSSTASSSATAIVAAPQAPTAGFTYSPGAPVTGQSVSFDGSASSCSYAPCTYSWADDPPSGGSWALGSGQRISFTFSVVGTKYVTLTMTDAAGRTATVEHDVVVTAASSGSAPTASSAPQITGTAQQGQTLSVSNGSWTGSPTSYAYQWQDCDSSGASCANISGATGSSYSLGAGDVGHTMRAMVTASNSSGSATAGSAPTAMVASSSGGAASGAGGAAPSNSALPVVSGSASQGSTLSTSNGSWNGSPTSFTYAWQDCDSSGGNCSNISGATAGSYTLVGADVGHTVRSVVTAHNSSGAASASSAQTGVVVSSGSTACNLNANTSNFSSQVSAASPGQTICLATGNYGTWGGVNKAITITAASGATPTLSLNVSSGGGFTLDHLNMNPVGTESMITGTAHDITIQNSTLSYTTEVIPGASTNVNVVFNHDHFPLFVANSGPHSMVWDECPQGSNGCASGTGNATGVVIENSVIDNPSHLAGVADGIDCDANTTEIDNNDFSGINDASSGGNHGDNIQVNGGICNVKGNYFHGMLNSASCSFSEWDGGGPNVIENNVVDTGGCYEAIALLADHNSTVDHNTFITPSGGCFASPQSACAAVDTGARDAGQSGFGTVYRDNVMAGINNGDGGRNASYSENHNLCLSACGGGTGDVIGTPTLAGGSQPTTFNGFALASGSPGIGAASDGTNTGIQLPTGG